MYRQLLSIAMCNYNGAQYLQQQLNSISAQTRLPDELFICDNCSSDTTVEIIYGLSRKAPFPVRLYLNEVNLGTTRNFAKTIGLCEGDVIALSDQDDVWHQDKLLRIDANFVDTSYEV